VRRGQREAKISRALEIIAKFAPVDKRTARNLLMAYIGVSRPTADEYITVLVTRKKLIEEDGLLKLPETKKPVKKPKEAKQ